MISDTTESVRHKPGIWSFYSHPPHPLWFRSARIWDVSTGPLACPFVHSLLPRTHLLTLHSLLCLCAPQCSIVCSLYSLPSSSGILMSQNQAVLNHSSILLCQHSCHPFDKRQISPRPTVIQPTMLTTLGMNSISPVAISQLVGPVGIIRFQKNF